VRPVKLARAAGGLLWRDTPAGPRLAVIHRTRRDDWSLPKGRLDAGERWDRAACREVEEETGCEVSLGAFAGAKLYVDRPQPKLVLYWHMAIVRLGPLESHDEVDEVAWLTRREALARLDHGSDRRLLLRAMAGAGPARHLTASADLRSLVVRDGAMPEQVAAGYHALIADIVERAAAHRRARQA
jgi:8-oxo-dGTP pyrophosphatase MutT (NUDIX family)